MKRRKSQTKVNSLPSVSKSSSVNLPTNAPSTSSKESDNRSPTTLSISKKENNANWIAIINLILTTIIGIGGIVEALYLNNQNEKAQFKIIQVQADIQRENTFAHIAISRIGTSIEIKNLGPSIANNVKIIISLSRINNVWSKSIKDINGFTIYLNPPTLVNSIDTTKSNNLSVINDKNAFKISINSLPPGIEFVCDIEINNSVKIKEYTNFSAINVYVNSSKESISQSQPELVFDKIVDTYISQQFYLASFDIYSSCDNCEVKPDDKFANSNISFDMTSSSGYAFTYKSAFSNQDYDKFSVLTRYEGIIYKLPSDIISPSIPSSLLLKAYYDYKDDRIASLGIVDICHLPFCTQF